MSNRRIDVKSRSVTLLQNVATLADLGLAERVWTLLEGAGYRMRGKEGGGAEMGRLEAVEVEFRAGQAVQGRRLEIW